MNSGERVAIAGPSGSGKTTLLRVIIGLEAPATGEVCWDGQLATHGGEIIIPPHLRGVGLVLQDLGLWPGCTVRRHLQLATRDRAKVEPLLGALGLAKLASRKPGTLSGGEQQRIALGAALACAPRLLVLDEAFQGLDAVLKEELLAFVDAWAAERHCAVLCVTHDPAEAARLRVQRLIVLESAQITADLPWKILTHPCDPNESPTLRAWKTRLNTPFPS